jgi:D-tyrosyl-tRNA(Tyr) deacylase
LKLVIQRVTSAHVTVNDVVIGAIQKGYMCLLGISVEDTKADAEWLALKLIGLRIFSDENGLMNRSIEEVNGSILLISQFTLLASYKKGNRPSYLQAAPPEMAIPLYEYFIQLLNHKLGHPISTGQFGADMQVSLVNDGPVTIIMDSHNKV